ncbi:cation-translocating P-type ATPase [Anaeromyxobacter dehalogenans]|uniref:Cation transport ATPase, E1-E2 type n=1 Tax=Anaeromyxobacter dehalogenans (strain 2CP-C) TaxID=290397 RepID=Q2IED8_ANADE|nr:cation-translocating P-type ATPase [Anaeromyxobacter dehalogenans]ABC82947.1 Cation transport ATPase, E1-E2 type [Anaeromyxobacter dehalogenans 2CP-C]
MVALPEAAAAPQDRPPYRRSARDVVASLAGDAKRGLTDGEARDRLRRYGRNELPSAPPVPAWRRFLAQFKDVLTGLLLVATAVSFAAWWLEPEGPVPYEALTILAVVLLNGVLGFAQESRAEQALAALEAMSAPSARVLRDGEQRMVPTPELVPGDLLLLEEGDTIAADARVVESIALRAAESALTGESTAASKDPAPLADEVGIGDRTNMVFSGTAIAAGRGRAVVTGTGRATEIGRIAASLQATEEAPTPLQKELDRVGKLLGAAVVAIAVVIGATLVLVEHLSALADLLDVLLLAVSLAVAAVPEGLTAITTIVLSLGTRRMAERNVIVRKLSSVETLGSTTTICSDKTGTLTRNEMTVRAVVTASGRVDLTGTGYDPAGEVQQGGKPVEDPALLEEVSRTLAAGELANNAALRQEGGRWTVQGDPTEGALVVAARKVGHASEALHGRYPRVGEVPFSSERKLMSTAHTDAQDPGRTMVFSKGAPDVLLARCTEERVGAGTRPLTPARREELGRAVDALAAEALRTLGVAYRALGRDAAAEAVTEELEQALVFLGVVGMIDPPRPEARDAVARAKRAGVRPVMITGDHPATASAIAAELGIAAPGAAAVTGTALQGMDEAELRDTVREVAVYARVAPEHKLRIVRALHANGEIAAMTGDGVNDAPALKAADIGVAMGITGTDVAKGAADMVLADDDFASIVAAVEEGRSIFANIQRFLRFLLSSNIGEVLVMFLGVVFAGTIGLVPEQGSALVVPLLATQILWINLLTDSGPALALGVEPPDHDVMLRPPRDPRSRVLPGRAWLDIVFIGVVMAVGTLLVMDWELPGGLVSGADAGQGIGRARTMGFTTLVFFQLFNTFNCRFEHHSTFHRLFANRWLWLAVAGSAALQVAVVHLPFLQRPFRTVPLDAGDWLLCVAVASSVVWIGELKKRVLRGRRG